MFLLKLCPLLPPSAYQTGSTDLPALAQRFVAPGMATLDDGAGTDDEEERASKAAFFHELERRHGGPLSYEELQEFELSLKSEDSDSDDDEDVPPCTFGAPSSGVAAPPAAATPSCDETPGCGWMTPATPRHGKAAAAASPGASTAAGSDEDVVVTEAVGSRYASRRGSPGVCRPVDLVCLAGLSTEAAALPPIGSYRVNVDGTDFISEHGEFNFSRVESFCIRQPEAPTGMDVADPPPPPGSGQTYNVGFSFVAKGSIADFDANRISALKMKCSESTGVPASNISIEVSAASVNIVTTFSITGVDQAMQLETTLIAASTVSQQGIDDVFGGEVESETLASSPCRLTR